MRTFGQLRLVEGKWELECEPQVRIRAKRWFSRVDGGQRSGPLTITATPDTAVDLEAFLLRYPLDVRPPGEVDRQAAAFRAKQAQVERILEGLETLSPARPMALPAREYQLIAANLAYATRGLLLADELGLGKTVSAITLLSMEGTLPALVVVPAHMPLQWRREIKHFLPDLRVHVLKRGRPYDLPDKTDVLISTYHKLYGWAPELAGRMRTVVFDECQELRRASSNKYGAAADIAEGAEYRLGLSGTPIYNYGGEFWCVMNVLRPGALGTLFEFGREWCDGYFDATKMRFSDPAAFGRYVREINLMLRRSKSEVGRELPACEQIVHEVDMDADALDGVQTRAIDLAKIVLSSAERFERGRASQELSNAVRMATGISKAPYAAAFVRMLLEQGEGPVVLFGWHRAVYDIWAEALDDFHPCWVTGEESASKKQKEVDRFVNGESDLLIMSLRSGAGIDGLQRRCSRVVFGELDWSPGVHEQCIGRVFRDGQAEPVFAYFLVGNDGADPIMVDVLGLKTRQIDGIRDPDQDVVVREIDPDHVKKLAEAYLARAGGKR